MKALTLVAVLFTLIVIAAAPGAAQEKAKNPLVGSWVCEDEGMRVEIRADGTLTINGTEYAYKVKGSVINVLGEDGAMAIPFQLEGDTLTVDVEGKEMVYTRVNAGTKTGGQGSGSGTAPANRGGGVMQAMAGKWCYMSNLTGSNSYMSSRCFVLHPNGTYEYSAESSSGGAYGSTAGQSYDSGRWSATTTTLTADSNSQGKLVYPIQLRNHPKTGDAMIVVDGDAYVTATQRRPW